MASLIERLKEHRRVALDSMLFIYYFERHHRFGPASLSIFTKLERGTLQAITSMVSYHEVLIRPFRDRNTQAVTRYLRFFQECPNLTLLPINEDVAMGAARLRAEQRSLRAPDAFQLAAGIVGGATAFVTADRRLAGIKELKIVQLA